MYKRLQKIGWTLAAVLAAGVVYYGIAAYCGITIPCFFHLATGLYCPGCGVTRMCISLLHLDVYHAFRSNPAVLILLPFLAAIGIRRGYTFIRYGSAKHERWMTGIEMTSLVILLVFGVLRNLPLFSFLAPN